MGVGSIDNKVETGSYMDISDDDGPKYSVEVKIHETMVALEETTTSEVLDNQSTQKLQGTQYSRESDSKEQYMEETFPPGYQGFPDSIIEYMYTQFDIEEDDYVFDKIADHYFKNSFLFVQFRYVGDLLGEYKYNRSNIQNIEEIYTHRTGKICE